MEEREVDIKVIENKTVDYVSITELYVHSWRHMHSE